MRITLDNYNLPIESFDTLRDALAKRLSVRGIESVFSLSAADLILNVGTDAEMESDSFSVSKHGNSVIIRANDLCTVFAAAGWLLCAGNFDFRGGWELPELPFFHRMKCSMRGMYCASHFHNFYHDAPIEEVYEIIVDLALRGCNTLALIIGVQHYTSYFDPDAEQMIGRVRSLLRFADRCGIAPGMVLFSNSCFRNYPREFEAQFKNTGGLYRQDLIAEFNTEVCPSTEGGMREIEREHREFFEAFRGTPIKHFFLWAYDEGGCLCPKCYPWATNGFMKVAELDRRLVPEYGFDAGISISAWHFDIQMEHEWETFYGPLERGEYAWAPYILTSFRSGRMPGVLASRGIPEGVRLIEFPEISMCSAKPWGGFGANPITMFLDNSWTNLGPYHDGGLPYSEGIYEDINKFVCLGFYTGLYERSADAVRDYIRYEFGLRGNDVEPVLRAVQLMESSLPRSTEQMADGKYRFVPRWGTSIPEVLRLIDDADQKVPDGLRHSWKWRIVVLRSLIDYELYSHGYIPSRSPAAQEAFAELHSIFHTENAKFCVHPPLGM